MSQEEQKVNKKGITFKERYADPVFREKHKAYVTEPITCQCGRTVMRATMAKHLRSAIHNRHMKDKIINVDELQALIEAEVQKKIKEYEVYD